MVDKVLLSSLNASARIFGSRFHYKIKRQLDMSPDKLKVRLVLQGQHMNWAWTMSTYIRLCCTQVDFAPCLLLPLP